MSSKHTAKAIVRESKYRQLLVEARGAVDSYRDVQSADFASVGETIAASAGVLAYVTASNDIQAVGLKDTIKAGGGGKRATLKGHVNGPILDLGFSLLDYSLLASGGSDGTCKIWRVRNELEDVGAPLASLDLNVHSTNCHVVEVPPTPCWSIPCLLQTVMSLLWIFVESYSSRGHWNGAIGD